MRKMRIYLDTSVISHLHQSQSPEKMADTLAFWAQLKQKQYDIYISEITLREIRGNVSSKFDVLMQCLDEIDFTLISLTDCVYAYADKLVESGVLTSKHYADCLHIACAVVNECDMLISWNFKHIVRVKTINGVRTISKMLGYGSIDIYPPNMMIER